MDNLLSANPVKEGDLLRAAHLRANPLVELTVLKPIPLIYSRNDWKIKKEHKHSLRIYKEKTFDELFEDRVWLLFKRMGFKEMNAGRNFKIGEGADQMQIDVFAKEGKHVFIIECKTSENQARRDFSKDIREILLQKESIIRALRNYYSDEEDLRFTFLFATKNITLPESNYEIARESMRKDFYLLTEEDIKAYEKLTTQYGEHSRFIMYSILFQNREIGGIEPVEIPAIRGGRGNNKYYCFVIQPSKLLNGIIYIHRREEKNAKEIMYTYQRMLDKSRLSRIKEFVEGGGYFANNVIINFSSRPTFEEKSKIGDVVTGVLKFPKVYGSAWVIDGQHRLYGYLNSIKSEEAYLPVLAFDNIDVKEQAKLFIDINKEQKPVKPALLWDLYSDIYKGSTDPRQQELCEISIISKRLNVEVDSPLFGLIRFPSQTEEIQKRAHLSLVRVCLAMKENRFLNRSEHLLYKGGQDETIDSGYDAIKVYLSTIANLYSEDWARRETGLLCSNVGIRILFNVLRQLLKYLEFHGFGNIYQVQDKQEFRLKTKELLEPLLEKIKKMTDEQRADIRGATNREKIVENTQKLLWDLKEKTGFGVELWKNGGWTPGVPEEESDRHIKLLVEDTEKELKSFVTRQLKSLYTHGSDWWNQGVPQGVKEYIEKIISKDTSVSPYRKRHLENVYSDKDILRFATIPHVKETIIMKDNWPTFEQYFAKDPEIVSAAFKFYENLRNKMYGHPDRIRDIDEVEKGLGYWNMIWLRRCVGLSNPRFTG